MIKTDTFQRKTFNVEAIQVTEENMADVAAWCQGDVRESDTDNGAYIKVRVHNALTEKQTKAFVGDWVLYAGKGYKVYTDKAFTAGFQTGNVVPEVKNVFNHSTVVPGPHATPPGGSGGNGTYDTTKTGGSSGSNVFDKPEDDPGYVVEPVQRAQADDDHDN